MLFTELESSASVMQVIAIGYMIFKAFINSTKPTETNSPFRALQTSLVFIAPCGPTKVRRA